MLKSGSALDLAWRRGCSIYKKRFVETARRRPDTAFAARKIIFTVGYGSSAAGKRYPNTS
ncbi:hypothetical protein OA90_25730 [Labrenzia sp. OB1]|nr:hypothetical protein OA90_25730 [Labrenzia sp. OB1]